MLTPMGRTGAGKGVRESYKALKALEAAHPDIAAKVAAKHAFTKGEIALGKAGLAVGAFAAGAYVGNKFTKTKTGKKVVEKLSETRPIKAAAKGIDNLVETTRNTFKRAKI